MNRNREFGWWIVARFIVLSFSLAGYCSLPAVCCAQDSVESAQGEETTTPSAADHPSPNVFCLRTEFYPDGHENEFWPDRLAREIGRQAVLIAARDSLGLATRDQSLQEPFPEAQLTPQRVMNAHQRVAGNGKFTLFIWRGPSKLAELTSGGTNDVADKRTWSHDESFAATPYQHYISIVTTVEPMIRGDIANELRGFGFEGKPHPPNPENRPPASIDSLLGEMNFVSAYLSVRLAHDSIAKHGESPEWVGVLVRGYSNLSLTTFHHWTSAFEVFASRALLYAERLVNSQPDDPIAYAHRAYARALVGLHAAALADLKRADSIREESGAKVALPSWLSPIGPYCRFERAALADTATDYNELKELVQRLNFELVRVFEDPRWLMESATTAMAICPEEYGIYATLANNDSLLAVKRTGAYYGPTAMGRLLPTRILRIPKLPNTVVEAARGNDQAMPGSVKDPQPNDPFSAVPANVARSLITANQSDTIVGEPSWAVLGKLIEEEQFTQVANFFGVITDATESPLSDAVNAVWPLVKDHRYAWYVKSFSKNSSADLSGWQEIVGDPQFVDPRGTMRRMFSRAWNTKPDQSRSGKGRIASWHALISSSIVFPELLTSVGQNQYSWWDGMGARMQERYANRIAAVSPYAPHALRFKIALVDDPTHEQLKGWESKAGEDPTVFRQLGALYADRRYFDDAIRCYERSIQLSPSYNAYVGLANSFKEQGQTELWRPTLERFLDVPALGLEHAWIHQLIADDYISQELWQAARPHAMAAAQTWSATGLQLAAEVFEGLGQWNESEKWIREASTSYPTGLAAYWYFWCRRTGRGDLAEARRLAEKTMTPDWIKADSDGELTMLTFYSLEGNPQKSIPFAMEYVKELMRAPPDRRAYSHAVLALVAHEASDKETEKTAITELRRLITEEGKALSDSAPAVAEITETVCNLLDGKDVGESTVAAMTEAVEKLSDDFRPEFVYLLGRAFELRDNVDVAEKFYRSVIHKPPFKRFSRTLAGHRLAKRHGTSRP